MTQKLRPLAWQVDLPASKNTIHAPRPSGGSTTYEQLQHDYELLQQSEQRPAHQSRRQRRKARSAATIL